MTSTVDCLTIPSDTSGRDLSFGEQLFLLDSAVSGGVDHVALDSHQDK